MNIPKDILLRTAALISLAALCACGGKMYWRQDGRAESQIRQDRMQCEEEVANYSRYMGAPGDSRIVSQRMQECMGLRGYARVQPRELPKDAPRIE